MPDDRKKETDAIKREIEKLLDQAARLRLESQRLEREAKVLRAKIEADQQKRLNH
jgi:hypothetical protein